MEMPMDDKTLTAYDHAAEAFADEWEAQPPPTDLHAAVKRFFIPGPTADVGCGSGRDTAWLVASGYAACGFDASSALIKVARQRHPGISFGIARLPELEGIANASFSNVLCETVIMHLPPEEIAAAVKRLQAILVPGGVLYLSWRVTDGNARRDAHGRLYAAFDEHLVLDALADSKVLLDETVGSLSSGKLIHRLVMRKPA
jgi:SAM-dependent methyltransferase